MNVIGITGRAQHGKDTVAAVLVREFGYTRVAFADALKSMALVLDPVVSCIECEGSADAARLSSLVERYGWEGAKQEHEVRRFLQVLGTEGVRDHLGENSWVNAWQRATVGKGMTRVVVPDVRFPNEADHIRSLGGELWQVFRPGFDNGLGTDHPSEQNVDKLGATIGIANDGTIEDLEERVRGLMIPVWADTALD